MLKQHRVLLCFNLEFDFIRNLNQVPEARIGNDQKNDFHSSFPCIRVHTCTCIHTYNICIYVHNVYNKCAHIYIYRHIYMYIYIYISVHMYKYTHTYVCAYDAHTLAKGFSCASTFRLYHCFGLKRPNALKQCVGILRGVVGCCGPALKQPWKGT